MRLLLFLIITAIVSSDGLVYQSFPKMNLTSGAFFSSLSNTGLTTAFLDCGNTRFGVWSVRMTFTTTGKIGLCPSDADGLCTSAGTTTGTSAISINSGDTVYLGYSPSTRSFSASEVTTFTKIDGSFQAWRWCTGEEYRR